MIRVKLVHCEHEAQRERLRQHAKSSYERGLMDQLVLNFTPEGLHRAHEDPVLGEREKFATDTPVIRTVKAEDTLG